MNPNQIILVLQARKKTIYWVALTTIVGTMAVSLALPKSYRSTASVVLNYKMSDPVTGNIATVQSMPGYMPTQVAIIQSRSVALKVVDDLKLDEKAELVRMVAPKSISRDDVKNNLADWLLKKLTVDGSKESSVLDISFSSTDPIFATIAANSFAKAYQEESVRLKLEPTKKASLYIDSQLRVLRSNYDKAQEKLGQFQKQNGITNIDERMDVENNKLNELSSQLVLAESALSEASSRRTQAITAAQNSPDVNANTLVQTLKSNLATAQSKFQQIEQRLGANHPQYQQAKAEVDELRVQLDIATKSVSSGVATNAVVLQKRASELKSDFDAQKKKILSLNVVRYEMSVLQRELDSAQRAYELSAQRLAQTNLEGNSNQSDVSILSNAVVPDSPFTPKIGLNLFMSTIIGFILGVATAMILEMVNPIIRSAEGLIELTGLNFIGQIKSSDGKSRARIKNIFGLLQRK